MRVLIDGEPIDAASASISVFDHGLLRGDGCFEALRSYGGTPFCLDEHLDRLEHSARLLDMALPERAKLDRWVHDVADDGGECVVRVVATRGGFDPIVEAPPRLIVFWEPLPEVPERLSVMPLPAPWHPDGVSSELTGAKALSYAPNMAAGRAARAQGFDDALLLGRSGSVLEGPTFSIGWVVDGRIETPDLDLGILASITRTITLEEAADADLDIVEGRYPLSRLDDAQEVFAMSTVKEVRPIGRIGSKTYEDGSVTRLLASAYRDRVARTLR